jgi:hypothetical protein
VLVRKEEEEADSETEAGREDGELDESTAEAHRADVRSKHRFPKKRVFVRPWRVAACAEEAVADRTPSDVDDHEDEGEEERDGERETR